MANNIIKINAISIADVLKNINKEDKENLEKYSFVDFEGAVTKYSKPIKTEDVMNVIQFYLSALLNKFTEEELKEKTVIVELPEELAEQVSFIRQQNLLFRKGNSAFSVTITPYRELVVEYDSEINAKDVTWYSNILGILSVNRVVKDKSYMEFWQQA
ncbi:TPA: hypothetical protein CPT90_05710 [Candidatus Gastranaerophilales bacterium HUM_3]|nr:MAG TPA: hypothetical protein CPT90_05710 [Candidatus Gastranaerophilales bacterium HUM_3]